MRLKCWLHAIRRTARAAEARDSPAITRRLKPVSVIPEAAAIRNVPAKLPPPTIANMALLYGMLRCLNRIAMITNAREDAQGCTSDARCRHLIGLFAKGKREKLNKATHTHAHCKLKPKLRVRGDM